MSRSDGDSGATTKRDAERFSVDRRSYLKLAGTAAGSAALFSGSASASFSRRGIGFKQTVDMVADAGCDPTGTNPCDQQIRDAADDFTLLKFPEGEYKITEKNFIYSKTNIGFLGEGDVRFSVPERFNRKLLVVDDGTGLLFEGIDIDLRADGATPGLHLGADDDLEVHDVEFIGQGIHPDSDPRGQGDGNPHVTKAFYPIVRSPDGTGTVRNLVAKNAGLMGAYNHGEGRTGVWIGMQNKGTVTLEDCHIEGFPNNATYCSRTPGTVRIEGGVFKNNDVSQIRISSRESYAKNASVQVDHDSSNSPNPTEVKNSAGVFLEGGPYGYGGAVIHDCEIAMRSVANSNGGVVVGPDGADHTVKNTRMVVEENDVRAAYVYPPTGFGSRNPPPKPHDFEMHNVSITGDAAGNEAIQIRERPNSVIEGCCIRQTGANRDGIVLKESKDNSIVDTTINVTGDEIYSRNCTPTTNNISESGSCPTPNFGDGGSSLSHVLSIETTDGRASYAFSVSGELEKSTANGATVDDKDSISGSIATGQGGDGGIDSYAFSGELVSFDLDGEANVTVDGEPAHVGQLPEHVLTIAGGDGRFSYTFSVSDDLEKSTANGATIDDKDTISGNTATGQGGDGGVDSYTFSGDLEAFDLDSEANVTVDGESAHVGQRPDHVLMIEGSGPRADYTFTVADDLEKSTANGADRNDSDTISGQTATGHTTSGKDSYTFSGDLKSFDLNGEATVILDGKPAHVGQRSDHVLMIEGAGPRADYTFTVTDNLEKSTANGADRNDSDTISGRTATGYTTSGVDSYTFSGDLEAFSLDGKANVTLDGEPAHVGQLPEHVLTIEGAGPRADYTFTVADDLEKSTANGADRNDSDTISGQTATGHTTSGEDSYTFSGDLKSFDLNGEATVILDGKPAHVGQLPDHVLTIEGSGPRADYTFTVADDLEKSTANGADRNDSDTISGQTATGHTTSGKDSYTFSGDLKSFDLNGEATVILDGKPAHVGQRSDHVLMIEGAGPRADYTFTVTDNLEKSTANGADRNDSDTISGQTATGHTTSGKDSYTFSGDLEAFSLDGKANVTLDGEPAHVGQLPEPS